MNCDLTSLFCGSDIQNSMLIDFYHKIQFEESTGLSNGTLKGP